MLINTAKNKITKSSSYLVLIPSLKGEESILKKNTMLQYQETIIQFHTFFKTKCDKKETGGLYLNWRSCKIYFTNQGYSFILMNI